MSCRETSARLHVPHLLALLGVDTLSIQGERPEVEGPKVVCADVPADLLASVLDAYVYDPHAGDAAALAAAELVAEARALSVEARAGRVLTAAELNKIAAAFDLVVPVKP